MRRSAAIVMAVLLATVLAGCRNIPEDATKKEFCRAGEKFSASTTFPQGEASAERLAKIGTPEGISKRARAGFVELIDRVLDAKDGQDFIKRSKKISSDERKNLMALNDYIQQTCKQ